MNVILDEVKTYPELKTYELVNLYTDETHTVSMQQLTVAFSEKDLQDILNNRSDYWLIIED